MKRKEQTIVEKEIPGREHAGYAYIYPLDGGARQEYVLEMTPENIANFIGAHQYDAEKIILTDMLDNLIQMCIRDSRCADRRESRAGFF